MRFRRTHLTYTGKDNQAIQHFSLTFFVELLEVPLLSSCRLIFRFFSSVNNSWNSSLTLWFVFAEVSIKLHTHFRAWASPSCCKQKC